MASETVMHYDLTSVVESQPAKFPSLQGPRRVIRRDFPPGRWFVKIELGDTATGAVIATHSLVSRGEDARALATLWALDRLEEAVKNHVVKEQKTDDGSGKTPRSPG